MKSGAVVVTYFPNERFLNLINNLILDFNIEKIIIVDNTDANNWILYEDIIKNEKVILIENKENLGIARALNQGIECLASMNFDWVLTMDQDSNIGPELLEKYKEFVNKNNTDKIGMLGTNYIDINLNEIKIPGEWNEKEVNEVISSGSFLNMKIFSELKGFKEHYFIDQVDNEYCFRLIKNNYKIFMINGIDLEHSMGDITRITIGPVKFHLYNQKPIRTFYRTRNMIYMMKEYKELTLIYSKIMSLLIDFIKIAFEKESLHKYLYFIKGVKTGILGELHDK
ncbi:glycosyltransferase family 2 protein [Paenibacillus sp. B-A-8]|uniref:glycosyltransferase family 2 protein n=1 Tax=Paenibacillus sp. B-A-8 TaxID=3400419 RepID=UPI003B02A039